MSGDGAGDEGPRTLSETRAHKRPKNPPENGFAESGM